MDGTTNRPGDGSGARRYMPIADHGLIGDLRSVALVATDGTIDWYCAPRFDAPSVFAALLDAERAAVSSWRRPCRPYEAVLLPRHERADHPVLHRGRRR